MENALSNRVANLPLATTECLSASSRHFWYKTLGSYQLEGYFLTVITTCR